MTCPPIFHALRSGSRGAALAFLLLAGSAASAHADGGWAQSLPPDVVLHFQPHTATEAARPPLPGAIEMGLRARSMPSVPLSATVLGSTPWQEWAGSTRASHALVRDTRRQRWLAAGGSFRLDVQGSVWAGDPVLGDWSQITARPDGGARGFVDAAYDSLRDRLLVLTVDPLTSAFGLDAFTLSSSSWQHLWDGGVTGNDMNAGMAIDTYRDELAILGTYDSPSAQRRTIRIPLTDPTAWSVAVVTGSTSPLVTLGSAVYVPAHDRFEVVFDESGLWYAPGGAPRGSVVYRITAGAAPVAAQEPNTDFPSGSPRKLAYDPVTDRLFVTSDQAEVLALSMTDGALQRLDDGQDPGARDGAALGFDPLSRRLLLYGGQRYDACLQMFESLAADSGVAWTLGQPPASTHWHPEAFGAVGSSIWHTSLVDPQTSRLVVFGGTWLSPQFAPGLVRSHTIGAAGGWTVLGTGSPQQPRERFMQATVYDPLHHAMLLFGGQATDGTGDLLGDLWSLSLDANGIWTPLVPSGVSPGGLRAMSMTYDAPRQRFLVFGGDDLVQQVTRIWELQLTPAPVWRELGFAGEAPPVYPSVFADPLRGDGWNFTGNGSGYTVHHLVFEPDTVRSVAVQTMSGGPGGLGRPMTISFDAPHRRLMSIWTPTAGASRGDLSKLVVAQLGDSVSWSVVPVPGGTPYGRYLSSSAFDPTSDQFLLSGGYDDDATYFGDAWQVGFVEPTPVSVSIVDASADQAGAHLRWYVPMSDAAGVVERSTDGVAWTMAGAAQRSGEDAWVFVDATLAPGGRAAYRLSVTSHGETTVTAAVWVTRPASTTLALSAAPRAPGAPLAVRFTLAPGTGASLHLYDVSGRQRESARLEPVMSRWEFHNVLEPGLYFAEITQGHERRSTRLVLTR